jgi:hypothetical protein
VELIRGNPMNCKDYDGYTYVNPIALNEKCHCCNKNIPFACVTTIDGTTRVMENVCKSCLYNNFPEEVADVIQNYSNESRPMPVFSEVQSDTQA